MSGMLPIVVGTPPLNICEDSVAGGSSDSSSDSISSDPRLCVADRDNPRPEDAGFRLEQLIQFFYLRDEINVRKHSPFDLEWNSTGHLVFYIRNAGDPQIPALFVWGPDRSGEPWIEVPKESSSDDAGSSDSSDACIKTEFVAGPSSVGVQIRAYALRGSYALLGDSSDLVVSSSDGYRCNGSAMKFYFEHEVIACRGERISDVDPSLTDIMSELVLDIDSGGHLLHVYWGPVDECGRIPCVWDRENPPLGKAGVIVPVVQWIRFSRLAPCYPYDGEGIPPWRPATPDSFRIYTIHFDCLGHYIRTCLYAEIYGCSITEDDSAYPFPCNCEEFACVRYIDLDCPGETGSNYDLAPPTAVFDCLEASVNCDPDDWADFICTYNLTPNPCCDPSFYFVNRGEPGAQNGFVYSRPEHTVCEPPP